MKKRIISFFTSLIMIFSLAMVMPGIRASALGASYAVRAINELKSKYPHCVTWHADGSAYSGACGTGWQCQGYAYECLDTIFQNAKYEDYTKLYNTTDYCIGDEIRTNGGHSMIVVGINGNTISITDCNYDYKNTVRWVDKSESELASQTNYVRRNGNTLKSLKTDPMTTPNISFSSNSYVVGDTMHISWDKTSANSDFYKYWLIIRNKSTNKQLYAGDAGSTGNVNKNYYDLKLDSAGTYKVSVYAVPYTDKDNNQKLAEKNIEVYSLVTPSITYDKTGYSIGDTVKMTWAKSDENAIAFYWLVIKSPSGKVIYDNPTTNKSASYQFIPEEHGNYSIKLTAESLTKECRSIVNDTLNISSHIHSYTSQITK